MTSHKSDSSDSGSSPAGCRPASSSDHRADHLESALISPRALSISQFCRLHSVGRTFTYEEIAAGRLRAVKAGRRTLIPCEAAEAWLASLPELKKPNPINIEEKKTQRSAQAD